MIAVNGHKTMIAKLLPLALLAAVGLSTSVSAQEHDQAEPAHQEWSFSGPFGTFDRAQLQRGFQVYKEVCAACHSMNLMSYRNLVQPGGPEFTEAQAKAMAADFKVPDHDDEGNEVQRAAELKDRFANPFPNPKVAEATYGKVPPDLSLMAKARFTGRGFPRFLADTFSGYNINTGPDYIYAVLTGYGDAPAGHEPPQGAYFNKFFPGNNIAMPNMLAADGQVQYQDGTAATVDNYARDVVAFLMWTAEPKLEERKRVGLSVLVFLTVFAGLLYFTKKKVWSDLAH